VRRNFAGHACIFPLLYCVKLDISDFESNDHIFGFPENLGREIQKLASWLALGYPKSVEFRVIDLPLVVSWHWVL